MKTKEKVLIAGGTGLIGKRIMQYLPKEKYHFHILTRNPLPASENVTYYRWDLHAEEIDMDAVKVDHIINLTGAGIADKRWSDKRKKNLIDSRVDSLNLLKKALQKTGHRPASVVSASAIGYYGDRSDELLSESSSPGKGFMAECCELWENAAHNLEPFTDRLSIIRIGIVLSTQGGALPKILMTKGAKILNYFGSGEQYYSWIHIDDLCKMITVVMNNLNSKGIYNGVSPTPLTNKQFVKGIGKGLPGKFVYLPVPAFGLRMAMGEMADVVLNSNRVLPYRIQKEGFEYAYGKLPDAIKQLIETKI